MTQPAATEHCWHPYPFRTSGATLVSRCCFYGEKVSGEFIQSPTSLAI